MKEKERKGYVVCDYYNSEAHSVKLTEDQFNAICWLIDTLKLEYNCYTMEEYVMQGETI